MADDEKKEEFEMEYRMLGATGLKVSVLGLGTMSFTSTEQATELMSAVRGYGVNFFDNAEFYGNPCGLADKYFGDALKKLQAKDKKLWRRSDLVITTKLYFGTSGGDQPNSFSRYWGPNELGLSRKHLMEGMNESLERLQLDYVDVVYAHWIDDLTPMEEIVRGFNDIIQSGKAFYWGTSNWTAQKITEAYWVAKINKLMPPVVEQPNYNMLTRDRIEKDLVPMYAEPYRYATTVWGPLHAGVLTGKYLKGIPEDSRPPFGVHCMPECSLANIEGHSRGYATTVWGPLHAGVLTGKYLKGIPKDSRIGGNSHLSGFWGKNTVTEEKNKKVEKLMEIAKEMGVSMVALALGWTIKNKNVTVCLLGGSKGSQLEQNKHAITAAKKLNADLMKRIDEILDNKPNLGFKMRAVKNLTNPQ
eukprot:CAMPEP_0197073176 /NCGR_PEP_ID=MMETSP1384-20130603/210473_1 /TAXON_ID=29189 /ORGANISM="Ammonia sp." /LENGTH=415 /DNA_ID=CAMNT_0042512009 /DNA_START=107 /DNA_END=1355 /DNA_ORIENTATION=+